MSSAINAMNMRPLYGARNGSSARSGLSELPFGTFSDAGVFTELESAQVQFPPHAEIAGEAVERIAESRRPVVLEAEMPEPREAVAAEQRAQQPPGLAGGDECQQAQHRTPGADVMQRARHRVAVFAQVERIELREAAEARILGCCGRRESIVAGIIRYSAALRQCPRCRPAALRTNRGPGGRFPSIALVGRPAAG